MSQWEGVMQHHAKSFYLASLFFPSHLLPRVKALYALCRWLDDAVDEAPNTQTALSNLQSIASDLSSENSKLEINQIYKSNGLDVAYMEDLIEGARDDLEIVRIKNEPELLQYCYKVAGTVGLAMFDLMGAKPWSARAHAVDLGIAMQITNICRDVKEDLLRQRIYIPESFLNRHQLSHSQLLAGKVGSTQLVATVEDLLQLADQYYESAKLAYQNIPWRTRGAIIIAGDLYRSIGLKLRRQGGDPMRGRTYLNKWEKTLVVSKSLLKWLASGLKRVRSSHNPKLHQGLEPWKQLRGFQ